MISTNCVEIFSLLQIGRRQLDDVKLAEKKAKKIGRYLGSKTLLTKLNSTCISLLLIAMYYF